MVEIQIYARTWLHEEQAVKRRKKKKQGGVSTLCI